MVSTLSEDFLDKLICWKCENYLSYFPIYTLKDKHDATKEYSICGRCEMSNKEDYQRNRIYEIAADLIKFPCRNHRFGCHTQLNPSAMAEHEPICLFQWKKCWFKHCIVYDSMVNLVNHYNSQHHQSVLKDNEFEFQLDCDNSFEYIVRFQNELFYFKTDFQSQTKMFKFVIIKVSIDTTKEIVLELNLVYQHINLKSYYSSTDVFEPELLELSLASFPDSSGQVMLSICEETIEDSTKNLSTIHDVYKDLKCSKCSTVLVPNNLIFRCDSSRIHDFCQDCKGSFRYPTSCPNCFAKGFKNIPCYNLNQLLICSTNHINFKCKYTECKAIEKGIKIIEHEKLCKWRHIKCPLKSEDTCNQLQSRLNTIKHIYHQHADYILHDLQYEHKPSINLEQDNFYSKIIKYEQLLFSLNFNRRADCFYWSLRILRKVTCSDGDKKYDFQIEMTSGAHQRILMTGKCFNYFRIPKFGASKGILMYMKQVQPFLLNGTLPFKVNIIEH